MGGRAGARRAGVLALLSGAVLVAGYLVFIQLPAGQRLDERGLRSVVRFGGTFPVLDAVPVVSAVCGVLALVIALVRRLGPFGVAAALLPAVAPAVADLLKIVLPRPLLTESVAGHSNSYPSGHTATSTGAVLALVVVLPVAARLVTATLGSIWVAFVGTQLVEAGFHRPGDVLGGAVLALFLTACLVWLGRCTGRGHTALGPRSRGMQSLSSGGRPGVVGLLVAALVVVACVVVLAVVPFADGARPHLLGFLDSGADLVRLFTAAVAAAGVFAVLAVLPWQTVRPARTQPGLLALDDLECQTEVGTRTV